MAKVNRIVDGPAPAGKPLIQSLLDRVSELESKMFDAKSSADIMDESFAARLDSIERQFPKDVL